MKVAILTFHCAHNYGAVLQTYALQEVLRTMGHDVYVLDYRPRYITKEYGLLYSSIDAVLSKNIFKMVYKCLLEVPFFFQRIRRRSLFNSFINNRFNLRPFQKGDPLSDIDTLVVGSDQVWEQRLTGWDDIFWGCGIKCNVVAYGASMRTIDEAIADQLVPHLSAYSAISVREKSIADVLFQKGIHATWVMDPTILAGPKIFSKLAIPPVRKRPYVFIYQLGFCRQTRVLARQVAKQLDCDIVELTQRSTEYYSHQDTQMAISPEQFVGFIRNASCVFTTSFHGLAFSLLFKKSFYVMRQGTAFDNRAESLLSALNLSNRMLPCNTSCLEYLEIDYSSTDSLLDVLRGTSMDFLNTSI